MEREGGSCLNSGSDIYSDLSWFVKLAKKEWALAMKNWVIWRVRSWRNSHRSPRISKEHGNVQLCLPERFGARISALEAGNGGIVAVVHFLNRSSGRLWTLKQEVLCDGRKSLGKSRQNIKTWTKRVWDLNKFSILMKSRGASQEPDQSSKL